jgi:hypothetical protein
MSTLVEYTELNKRIGQASRGKDCVWPKVFQNLRAYKYNNKVCYTLANVNFVLDTKKDTSHYDEYEAFTIHTHFDGRLQNIRVLTRHGIYRFLFELNSPLGNYCRKFIYTTLDFLDYDGNVSINQINDTMDTNYPQIVKSYEKTIEELEKRCKSLETQLDEKLYMNQHFIQKIEELNEKCEGLEKFYDSTSDPALQIIFRKNLKQLYIYKSMYVNGGLTFSTHKRKEPALEIMEILPDELKLLKEKMDSFHKSDKTYLCTVDDIAEAINEIRYDKLRTEPT